MTTSKLNQLTEATDLVNADLLLLEQNSTAKKLTWRTFLEKTLAALSGQSGILRVSGRNLLDNPFFTVNQRGTTAYAVGYYGVDRWKLVEGSATVTDNGIVLNGTLRQILEQKPSGEVTASVRMYSGTGSAAYDSAAGYFDITSSGGTVRAAKLEAGPVSTLENDEMPNYAAELAKCQRYYTRIRASYTNQILVMCTANASKNVAYGLVVLPAAMRVSPVIGVSGTFKYFEGTTWTTTYDVSSVSIRDGTKDSNGFVLNVNLASSVPTGGVGGFLQAAAAGAYLEFIADL